MKFESPLFHPNSAFAPTHTTCHTTARLKILTKGVYSSLPHRRSLHLHPPPPRRRQVRLRIRRRALVPRADPREYLIIRDFDAVESQRRESGECRGREAVAGGSEGVQETG